MRRTVVIGVGAVVLLGALALLWRSAIQRDAAGGTGDAGSAAPGASGAKGQAAGPGAARPRGVKPAPTSPGAGPRSGPRPPAALDPTTGRDSTREAAVRDKIERVLEAHPGVARIDSITCDATDCRVELEARELDTFAPAYERLQEPETGFAGEANTMALEAPVALGSDGAGPWRIAFVLKGRGR